MMVGLYKAAIVVGILYCTFCWFLSVVYIMPGLLCVEIRKGARLPGWAIAIMAVLLPLVLPFLYLWNKRKRVG